jgi:DME family drug/metabolite transporter
VRVSLALVVLAGVALTVFGVQGAKPAWNAVGIVGGMVAAVSYAGTTLLARYVVPRYGSLKMLFWELLGGTIILAVLLPLVGRPLLPGGAFPAWMQSTQPWIFIVALGISTVVLANFAFFGATKRIDAAPTAVGASCEPVVGSLAALAIFGQNLTPLGWAGLALVVSGVVTGYLREARETDEEPNAPRG